LESLQEIPVAPRVEEKKTPPPKSPVIFQPGQVFQDKLKDGSLGPKVVWLPKGRFKMGSTSWFGDGDEKPIHEVTINYELAVGKYQVAVEEFKKFVQATDYKTQAEMGYRFYKREQKTDANWKNPYFAQNDSHPVVYVSWNDAKAYVKWLSEQTEEKYRLLSEAEWEYACRAGSTGKYCFGDDVHQLASYGWFNGNSEEKTQPVGQKKPNAFGLYDMHGNVWEWCEDVWHKNYSGAPNDGNAWLVREYSVFRINRGGSWRCDDSHLRCATRNGDVPTISSYDWGFRIARM
jgi:formylglycine-generating enzyme required for sulfatase activity